MQMCTLKCAFTIFLHLRNKPLRKHATGLSVCHLVRTVFKKLLFVFVSNTLYTVLEPKLDEAQR